MTPWGRFSNTLFSASDNMEAVRGYHISPLLRLQIQWLYYCAEREAALCTVSVYVHSCCWIKHTANLQIKEPRLLLMYAIRFESTYSGPQEPGHIPPVLANYSLEEKAEGLDFQLDIKTLGSSLNSYNSISCNLQNWLFI